MGGLSHAYETSLLSGASVVEGLNKRKYEVSAVLISRAGSWPITPEELKNKADIAFIAMHSQYGEDGAVQDILGRADIPYTGSDVLPSALGMNKIFSSRLFKAHNLNVPEFVSLNKHSGADSAILDITFPVIIKPVDRGLSAGISLVRNLSDVGNALNKAFGYSREAMVQQYIAGREIACFVMDNGAGLIIPLPPIEIIPKINGFFDYHTKHNSKMFEARMPVLLSAKDSVLIQETAAKAHKIIGASGVSKVDMILSPEGKLYVLEINTIPIMGKESFISKAAKAYGLSFEDILDKTIEAAFKKYGIAL